MFMKSYPHDHRSTKYDFMFISESEGKNAVTEEHRVFYQLIGKPSIHRLSGIEFFT